jgi:23S rRNA pseudouridine2605 synthase
LLRAGEQLSVTRINKYISLCGVTSRRGAETLIAEKRVKVNGELIEKVGIVIDESSDKVTVDDLEIRPVETKVYVVLNKPRSVMTTLSDPFHRKTVVSYLKKLSHRVYPVGRLDFDTEGVLLLTNDGDLAYKLAHPRFQIPKVYEAKVTGEFELADAIRIQRGIKLEDGAVGRALVDILSYGKTTTKIRLTLTEGRKREVKQLCEKAGHPVELLRRTSFAEITASGLSPGEWRYLRQAEISHLQILVAG